MRLPLSLVLFAGVLMTALGMTSIEARADFRVCNATQNPVGVSIGYRAKTGWVTEGWWHIDGSSCKTLIEGPLTSRYYYLYAEDAQGGGRWEGKVNMCVAEKEFRITGVRIASRAVSSATASVNTTPGNNRAGWFSSPMKRRQQIPPLQERIVNEAQPQGQDSRHARSGVG